MLSKNNKIRFLSDENIATSVVHALRNSGFNVKDIKEEGLYGTSDEEIIKLANKEDRIIITHDKDFGNVIRNEMVKHSGIILVRLKNQNPANTKRMILNILNSDIRDKLRYNLTVISKDKIIIHKR